MTKSHVRPSKFLSCWRHFARYLCCIPLIFLASQVSAQTQPYAPFHSACGYYQQASQISACRTQNLAVQASSGRFLAYEWNTPHPNPATFQPLLNMHFCKVGDVYRNAMCSAAPPKKCEADKDMGTQEAWNVKEIDLNGGNLTCTPGGCEVSVTFEGMLVGPDSQGIYGPAKQTGNECTPDDGKGDDDEKNDDKCPKGYVPSKFAANVCVPEEEPDRECPNGHVPSKYVKGVCVPDKETNRECPKGFKLQPNADICVPDAKEKEPTKPREDGSGDGNGEGEGGSCGAPGQPRCNVQDVQVEAAVRDVEKAVDINTEAVVENTKEVAATKNAVDKNTEAVKDAAKQTKDAINSTKKSVDGVKDAVDAGTSKLDQSLKKIEDAIKNQKPGTGGGGNGEGGEGEGDSDIDKYCKENPKALACSGIEEVEGGNGEGSGPETITITYQAESLFSGSGSCPANAVTTVGNQSLTVWDWAMACGFISGYVRPIVLALAFMSALMILIPRNE